MTLNVLDLTSELTVFVQPFIADMNSLVIAWTVTIEQHIYGQTVFIAHADRLDVTPLTRNVDLNMPVTAIEPMHPSLPSVHFPAPRILDFPSLSVRAPVPHPSCIFPHM